MSEERELSPSFDSLQEMISWCRMAPEGMSLDARVVADLVEAATEVGEHEPGMEDIDLSDLMTWQERLWIVPAETQIGVDELVEALNRPKSFVYKQTSAGNLPHRKNGGVLVFRVGEIRAWIRDRETVIRRGPSDSGDFETKLRRRAMERYNKLKRW